MKTIGILGGGQLGRMLALAAHPLGMRVRIFDPASDAPAAGVAEHLRAEWDDQGAIDRFCDGLDVATLELEALPLATARRVASQVALHPSPQALAATQDRLAEKELARALGIPTAPFARVDAAADLAPALERLRLPALLKNRTLGYDGRGQSLVRERAAALDAWQAGNRRPSILESHVPFDREMSLVAVRGLDGDTAFYPLVENLHASGILRRTIAPAPGVSPILVDQAHEAARLVLDALGYIGVLALEFFEVDGRLLLNELAPRVHNSGHWTIEGAATSQFENHLRAVAGLPLGSTEPRGWSAMVNVIGALPEAERVLALPGAHLHLYGKAPREGRKLGHATVTVASPVALGNALRSLERALELGRTAGGADAATGSSSTGAPPASGPS